MDLLVSQEKGSLEFDPLDWNEMMDNKLPLTFHSIHQYYCIMIHRFCITHESTFYKVE